EAESTEHAAFVAAAPALDELAVAVKAVGLHIPVADRLAGRRLSHQLSPMCPDDGAGEGQLVAGGHEVIHRHVQVGEGCSQRAEQGVVPVGPWHLSGTWVV